VHTMEALCGSESTALLINLSVTDGVSGQLNTPTTLTLMTETLVTNEVAAGPKSV
jgi:hypothetical protein